jgi:pentose-5-phosphate-3-epimerase
VAGLNTRPDLQPKSRTICKDLSICRKRIDDSGFDIRLEIDGGVKVDNIREIKAAGADMFVAGSVLYVCFHLVSCFSS